MHRRFAFVIWFPVFATTLLIAFMALRSLTPVQSGPGGLTALANIPNFVVLGICSIFAIGTIVLRPKPLFSSAFVAIATIVVYAAIVVAISISPLSGHYQTTVCVVDWSGRPISNLPVTLSISRTFTTFAGILAPSTTTDFYTNQNGEFSIRSSVGQNVYCSLNALPKRLKPYRYASLIIEPRSNNGYSIQHSWSNKDFDYGTNMHIFTVKDAAIPQEIKVFVPTDKGDDANPYL